MAGRLWFLQLSGWPVFLIIVTAVLAFSALSVVLMTWASKRSVLQNAIAAVLALAAIAVLGLAGAALLFGTR